MPIAVVLNRIAAHDVGGMGKQSDKLLDPSDLVQAQIRRDVSESLDEEYKGRAVKHSIISRAVAWFIRQPPQVKRVVLGETENMEKDYAAALRLMADELDARKRPPGMTHRVSLEKDATTPDQSSVRRK